MRNFLTAFLRADNSAAACSSGVGPGGGETGEPLSGGFLQEAAPAEASRAPARAQPLFWKKSLLFNNPPSQSDDPIKVETTARVNLLIRSVLFHVQVDDLKRMAAQDYLNTNFILFIASCGDLAGDAVFSRFGITGTPAGRILQEETRKPQETHGKEGRGVTARCKRE